MQEIFETFCKGLCSDANRSYWLTSIHVVSWLLMCGISTVSLKRANKLWETFSLVMTIVLATIQVPIYLISISSGDNQVNEKIPTPESQMQSQSETLKAGDKIIVENAPNRLQKWETAYRKIRCKGSAKNGDIGEILATKIHNGYTMHYIEWCNEEMNWVAEKEPGGEIYLKKR